MKHTGSLVVIAGAGLFAASKTRVLASLAAAAGLAITACGSDDPSPSASSPSTVISVPPLRVAGDWTVAPGLDAGVFSTITREDGGLQLTAGQFPLYAFSGDAGPGDVNGRGSGGSWFVVAPDGKLVK
jgi:predicted lipoprotein with Yx(FWY)xxD motif